VRFSPDGEYCATASSDATVQLWACSESAALKAPAELSADVASKSRLVGQAGASSPASQAGDEAGPSALQARQVVFCPSAALSLDWNAESPGLFAAGTASGSVLLWDVERQGSIGTINVGAPPHLDFVTEVRFCARKQLLATVSSGQGSVPVSMPGAGPREKRPTLFQPVVSARSVLSLWNTTTLQPCNSLEPEGYELNSVAFNHNGSLLVTGASDGVVRVFDVVKGSSIMQWSANEHGSALVKVCLTPDETAVLALAKDGVVALWSLHRVSEALCKFPAPSNLLSATRTTRRSPNDFLQYGDVVLGHERPSQFLASQPGFGNRVELFDTGEPSRASWEVPHSQPVTSLDWFSGEASLVCTASFDQSVNLYKL